MSQIHESIGSPCKRCKEGVSVVYTRNDNFCHGCFVRFIRGKQRKQMMDDRFKVKFQSNSQQTEIVLDFHLDEYASLVLFDILVELLIEQKSMGPRARVGFLLNVVIIENSKFTKGQDIVDKLTSRYGAEVLKELAVKFKLVDPDIICEDLESILLLENYETKIINSDKSMGYWDLIDQTEDASTKEDLADIVHREIIRRYTLEDCVLIECDSMTTLAVRILSLTIQGRGDEISHALTDTNTLVHPLRDILHSELKVYAQLESLDQFLPEEKRNTVKPEMKSAKNKTVHELVFEYFQNIELEYPEVVSTVEKIGSKLKSLDNSGHICPICNKEIQGDSKAWLEQITVQGYVPAQTEEEKINVMRYMESLNKEGAMLTDKDTIDTKLCYGCLVTLGASGATQVDWPKRQTDADILEEYILTDGED